MTAIAILADAHLPDGSGTAQHACFDWAIAQLQRLQPDFIVAAGDMTACGDVDAARLVRQGIESVGVPFLSTPGNCEMRSLQTTPELESLLLTGQVLENREILILACNTMTGAIAPEERQAAETIAATAGGRPLVLVTHYYPDALGADSAAWLREFLEHRQVSLLICGHGHRDRTETIGATPAYYVRGLDPEKAKRATPAVFVFTHDAGAWSLDEIPFVDGTVDQWTAVERAEFLDNLGISCMVADETLSSIDWAAQERLPCLELRADALGLPADLLGEHIAKWRDAGGRYLSWHMDNISWDPATRSMQGLDTWCRGLERALTLDVQHLTLHPPHVPVGEMTPGSDTWMRIADIVTAALEPVTDTDVVLAVENLHLNPDEPADEHRCFGYLPAECHGWIEELRARLGPERVAFMLDIGHARTNGAYNNRFGLGQWFATMGKEIAGYHIHQVRALENRLKGHLQIDNVFGPNLSFAAFFWAWKRHQINHCPMFIEVRGQAARQASWRTMRDYLLEPMAPQLS